MTYKTINVYLDYFQEDQAYKIDNDIIKLNAYYIEHYGPNASKTKLKEAIEELGGLEKYMLIRMMGHGSVEGEHVAANNHKGLFHSAHIRHMLAELINSKDEQYIIFELLCCNSSSANTNHSTLRKIIDPLYITNRSMLCALGYKDYIIANDDMKSIYTEKLETILCAKEQHLLSQLEDQALQIEKKSQLLTILLTESPDKNKLLKALKEKSSQLNEKLNEILQAIDILSNEDSSTDIDANALEVLENELNFLETEINETDTFIALAEYPEKLQDELDKLDEQLLELLDKQILVKEAIAEKLGSQVALFSDTHCSIKHSVITANETECQAITYHLPKEGIFDRKHYQSLFNAMEKIHSETSDLSESASVALEPAQYFYTQKVSATFKLMGQYEFSSLN
ncbi:hypothetical protein L3V82_02810 [Thiotrichales bacterium 19S3-7]|nr:hypothetical protein [Thiotrichales bacterium 19S3-7]MCF6801100.1 hypothetical protein [Thiotrichales bacterium 19S3-11]